MANSATATAEALRKLAEAMAALTEEQPQQGKPQDNQDKQDGQDGAEPNKDSDSDPGTEESDSDPKGNASGNRSGSGDPVSDEPLSEKIQSIIRDESPTDPKERPGSLDALPDKWDGYRVYPPAKKLDRIAKAETLLTEIEKNYREAYGDPDCAPTRATWRTELDNLLPDQGLVTRLATKLMRHILAQQTRAWEFDCEEGTLDPARLARVVTEPAMPLAFKREREGKFRETAVTLLLDNSGSMNGDKIQVAATTADILARVLERCGVTVEILGFTSHNRDYAGGGRYTGATGRRDPLLHVIYKDAATPYRRTRDNYGLMLTGILSQNADGEALIWAYNRLCRRPEPRKILMVLSDGIPSCDYDGDGAELSYHLRAVIAEIEKRRDVELLAIGAMHDVTAYYKHAVYVRSLDQLGPVLLDELSKMFAIGRKGKRAA